MTRGMHARAIPRHVAVLLGTLLLVRLLAAVFITPEPVGDAEGYVESARRLLTTGSFAYPNYTEVFWTSTPEGDLVFRDSGRSAFLNSPPNALTMPGFAIFIAAIWAVTGFGDDPALAVRLVHAVLSVMTAGMVYLIARRVSERVALAALVIAAVYPPFILANSYLNLEVLYGFLLTLAVWLLLRWYDRPTAPGAAAAGAAFGAGFLVRPTALPWLLLACGLIALADRASWKLRITQGVLVLVVSLLFLAPWISRNLLLYAEPVAFGTSAPVNTVQALWHDHGEPFGPAWSINATPDAFSSREIARATKVVLDEGQQYAYDDRLLLDYYGPASRTLMRTAWSQDAAKMILARGRSVVYSLTRPYSVAPAAYGGLPFTISWVAHCVMLGLAAVGLTRLGGRIDMWIVASVPFYFIAAHAIIFPLWRHYFPTLGFVCVFAAVGVVFCYDSLRVHVGTRTGKRDVQRV